MEKTAQVGLSRNTHINGQGPTINKNRETLNIKD